MRKNRKRFHRFPHTHWSISVFWLHVGAELSTVTSHRVDSVLGARPAEGLFCVRFPRSSYVSVGFRLLGSLSAFDRMNLLMKIWSGEHLSWRCTADALCFSDDEGSREESSIYCLDTLACISISLGLRSHCLQLEPKSLFCQYAQCEQQKSVVNNQTQTTFILNDTKSDTYLILCNVTAV